MGKLRGSFSVGGGPTKHIGRGSMKRPTTTAPRSSYQKPSKVVPSSGVAQTKPTPIKGTPKVPMVSKTTTAPTTTTTAKKLSGPIKTIKKIKGAAQSRQSMLDEIMEGL